MILREERQMISARERADEAADDTQATGTIQSPLGAAEDNEVTGTEDARSNESRYSVPSEARSSFRPSYGVCDTRTQVDTPTTKRKKKEYYGVLPAGFKPLSAHVCVCGLLARLRSEREQRRTREKPRKAISSQTGELCKNFNFRVVYLFS